MIYSTRPRLLPAWVLEDLTDGPPVLPTPATTEQVTIAEVAAPLTDAAPEAPEDELWSAGGGDETVTVALPQVPVPPPFRPRSAPAASAPPATEAFAIEAPSIAIELPAAVALTPDEPSITRALATPTPTADASDGVTIVLRVPARGIVREVAPETEPAIRAEAVAGTPGIAVREEPSIVLEAVPVDELKPERKSGRAA